MVQIRKWLSPSTNHPLQTLFTRLQCGLGSHHSKGIIIWQRQSYSPLVLVLSCFHEATNTGLLQGCLHHCFISRVLAQHALLETCTRPACFKNSTSATPSPQREQDKVYGSKSSTWQRRTKPGQTRGDTARTQLGCSHMVVRTKKYYTGLQPLRNLLLPPIDRGCWAEPAGISAACPPSTSSLWKQLAQEQPQAQT